MGYIVAATHLGWRPYLFDTGENAVARTAVPIYAATIFVGGLIAAAVAAEIRKHVAAALREAEVRREMERLQRDMQIARSIQQGLLPKAPPRIAEFDIAGLKAALEMLGYYGGPVRPPLVDLGASERETLRAGMAMVPNPTAGETRRTTLTRRSTGASGAMSPGSSWPSAHSSLQVVAFWLIECFTSWIVPVARQR